MLTGKTIILGITGGIAAYKGAALCSKLVQAGAEVHVMMTESAAKFITPLTLQTLSRHPVHIDTFDERNPSVVTHIHLADKADLIVVAPATANAIAKLAGGFGDDMLTTTLLAVTSPILIAPAMNVHMYEHPAVVRNMELLAERGAMFVEPGTGQLACGYVAKGRLAEPEEIVLAVEAFFRQEQKLAGKKVLVTAGGTMERIDPVRYITNDSSGKMGFAIAEAARLMGADVTIVAGRTSVQPPGGVKVVRVESAQQMLEAVQARYGDSDIVIKAAAVADYRPVHVHSRKMKKSDDKLVLELEKTADILATLGAAKQGQFLVGFAAETDQVEQYAMDKLNRKHCDLIVANDVSADGAGFNVDTNVVQVYGPEGLVEALPLMSKRETAVRLLAIIAARMERRHSGGEAE
ncbi:bifunctional phosphopantothenoylcysteine decarboxylase/phosphopantothenate--cysteine ligase CoaBC [Paenibacillus protaetiae]|uniref:Coenzyme A biosynthesis bifunctional protein CoaBC n=1 Tax=Paenibacillus protaetiae TaxID=2509456 RepID=A0A4P6ESZ7_9BACL|nr:bifunctional phosphopantothenoylcysteine decarboxylase/phosphopantothenate--cysteine ligase CoaBC [Paenibacillus protaetiae]QAY65525.1 bifunctional phosphopantothenoylcysteine decarboxylase/phosphopantothenate--cysteine ligase CoaBC [Paenibacillus protaetiae]